MYYLTSNEWIHKILSKQWQQHVLDKYDKIWDKTKKTLNIKFRSKLVYNEKYRKSKVREFNGVIETNF